MIKINHRHTGAVLHRVDADTLIRAELRGANLSYADLRGADLSDADLRGIDLRGADLADASISGADLTGARLGYAILKDTNLTGADLTGADLGAACLSRTLFSQCESLGKAMGLATLQHFGPSVLDSATLRACTADLPDVFLEGIGYTRREIDALRALYVDPPLPFFSCFLAHGSQKPDSAFAELLRADLRAENIACWPLRYNLELGDRWADPAGSAARDHDRRIVVCGRECVFREEVVREIIRAIEWESRDGRRRLFPVRLDDFILSPEAQARFDALTPRLQKSDWLSQMKQRPIVDFTKWRRHDDYRMQFDRLLKALRDPVRR